MQAHNSFSRTNHFKDSRLCLRHEIVVRMLRGWMHTTGAQSQRVGCFYSSLSIFVYLLPALSLNLGGNGTGPGSSRTSLKPMVFHTLNVSCKQQRYLAAYPCHKEVDSGDCH